ncbi:hypothetical protein ABDB91_17700 [Desulfoscipio sp. XC116]|uniref:hypothetical protein n=1 Tax=Desulfoscipio sp. XC116 TaxID=3144975 RepID=UPI00325A9C52
MKKLMTSVIALAGSEHPAGKTLRNIGPKCDATVSCMNNQYFTVINAILVDSQFLAI